MEWKHHKASVVAALVIGAGAALALSSASVVMWLAAGAAVGLVVAAALNNLAGENDGQERKAKSGF